MVVRRNRKLISNKFERDKEKGRRTIDGINVFHQQLLVKIALQLGHGDVQFDLFLGFQGLFDLVLQSSQEERLQDLVELLDNIFFLRFLCS